MISRRVVVVWSIICLISIVYALSGCASPNESSDLSETISPTQGTSERTRAATKNPTPKPGPTSTKTPYPTPTPEPPTTAVKWVAVLEVTDVHNLVAGMKRLVIV